MIKKLLVVASLIALTTPNAFADDIDDLLGRISKENNEKARVNALYSNSTSVGRVSIPTVYNIRLMVGTGGVNSEAAQSHVWQKLDVVGNGRDSDDSGERRRVVAIAIKNVSKYSADGPWIKLTQFWINGAETLSERPYRTRVKTLENKNVSLDSIPNASMFSSMISSITSHLNVIANFYGTYELKFAETRVVYLDEPQFIDSVDIKAIATDNTPNYRGVVEVRFLFK